MKQSITFCNRLIEALETTPLEQEKEYSAELERIIERQEKELLENLLTMTEAADTLEKLYEAYKIKKVEIEKLQAALELRDNIIKDMRGDI